MNNKMKKGIGFFFICIPVISVFIKSSIDSGFVETLKMFLSVIGFFSVCFVFPIVGAIMVINSNENERMKEKKSNENEDVNAKNKN